MVGLSPGTGRWVDIKLPTNEKMGCRQDLSSCSDCDEIASFVPISNTNITGKKLTQRSKISHVFMSSDYPEELQNLDVEHQKFREECNLRSAGGRRTTHRMLKKDVRPPLSASGESYFADWVIHHLTAFSNRVFTAMEQIGCDRLPSWRRIAEMHMLLE